PLLVPQRHAANGSLPPNPGVGDELPRPRRRRRRPRVIGALERRRPPRDANPLPRRASRRGGGAVRSRTFGVARARWERALRDSAPPRAAAASPRPSRARARAAAPPPRRTGSWGSSGPRAEDTHRAPPRAAP